MELTNDQVEVLKEIPGYVRRDMLREYCKNHIWAANELDWKDPMNLGVVAMCEKLMNDMDAGVI